MIFLPPGRKRSSVYWCCNMPTAHVMDVSSLYRGFWIEDYYCIGHAHEYLTVSRILVRSTQTAISIPRRPLLRPINAPALVKPQPGQIHFGGKSSWEDETFSSARPQHLPQQSVMVPRILAEGHLWSLRCSGLHPASMDLFPTGIGDLALCKASDTRFLME